MAHSTSQVLAHSSLRRGSRAPVQPPEKPGDAYRRSLRTLGTDLLSSWLEVVRGKTVLSDFAAGLTVAAVALPLNLALAVASGLPPSAGLVAGAIGGGLAALFGGASLQVTGPAAALNVMVLGIATDFGAPGVAAAALMIGVLQLVLAFCLAGRLGRYVPESVLAGFTTGVGLKLLDAQIPEMLGFDYKVADLVQMMHRPEWLHKVSWIAVVCGLVVALLVSSTKQLKRFPAAILGIGLITAVSVYLGWPLERVGAIPSSFPSPALPVLPDERWIDLFLKTLPLALLAAVESLLSARVLDRARPGARPHNSNLELIGQGVANIGVGLMSGMPVTGVVVRSGVNVQSGAKTRLSAFLHAVLLAVMVLVFSEAIAKVPLAALAGLLCVVGVRLIEIRTLLELVRHERISSVAFVATAVGTVSGYLMEGLAAGLAIHALHAYLHRGAEAAKAELERNKKEGIRAVLRREDATARRPTHYGEAPKHHGWLRQIRERAHVASSAFVHGHASVIGRVVLGEHVHIAAGSSVRADEGSPFFIGDNSNIQDGVVIHALKEKHVMVSGEPWAVYVGRNVSMAHDALVHGPCYVGDDTFIGFKAVVHDSVVGAHCFIGIGAVVVGVEIPDGRFVPHGRIVDTADKVDALPLVTDAHAEFNEDVVEVNRGLAVAYGVLERRTGVVTTAPPSIQGSRRPPPWEIGWETPSSQERF